MLDSRLVDVWDRLDRAQEHFQRIEGMLRDYYRTGIGELRGEYDPNVHQPVPIAFDGSGFQMPEARLHTVIGELLHDLRSALEHLAWVLVEANGGNPTRQTSWPVFKTRPAPNKNGIHRPPGVAGGVSAAAAAVIDRAQPYQWDADYAGHPMWVLDKLWNIDKHRHIALRGLHMDGFEIPEGTPPFTFKMRVDSVSVESAELVLVPDDPRVDVYARTSVQVFVHEPEDGVATPLHGTLEHLIEATTAVIAEAERQCSLTVPSRPHAGSPRR